MPLGGEPPLDLVALRCARRHQPVLPGAFVAQHRPPVDDLVLERDHLVTSVASCFDIELTVSMREIRSSRLLAPRSTASEDCCSPDV